MTRIYQPQPLIVSAEIQLDEKASHHLARVLRAKVGEEISVFNGKEQGEYPAKITAIDKKFVSVKLETFIPTQKESPLSIELAQGIARGEKMDFIIQKAVELGVAKITPIITERCNVRLDKEREEKRLTHWESVIISACEQCGRNTLPILMPAITLTDWIAKAQADLKIILSPHTKKTSLPLSNIHSIALLIGPEGGLSRNEETAAEQQGFQALQLGPRILRTETASLAAITAMQCQFGDFLIA